MSSCKSQLDNYAAICLQFDYRTAPATIAIVRRTTFTDTLETARQVAVSVVIATRQQKQRQKQQHPHRQNQDRYLPVQEQHRQYQEQKHHHQHRKNHDRLSPHAKEQRIKLLLDFLESYLTYYDSAVDVDNAHKQRDTKVQLADMTIDAREKSINIALAAAREAEAANVEQMNAAEEAEIEIKHKLAKKTMKSAFAAQAALVDKLQLMDHIKLDINEEKALIDKEMADLQSTECNVQTSLRALKIAERQISDLMKVVLLSQTNLATSQALATHAQSTMAARMQFVESAKNHLQFLRTKYKVACKDYEKTRSSAYKAALAAVVAKATAIKGDRKLRRLSSCVS